MDIRGYLIGRPSGRRPDATPAAFIRQSASKRRLAMVPAVASSAPTGGVAGLAVGKLSHQVRAGLLVGYRGWLGRI